MRDLLRLAACLLCAAVILAGCGLRSGSSGRQDPENTRTGDSSETERASRTRRSSASAEGSSAEGSFAEEADSSRAETPDPGKNVPGDKTAEPAGTSSEAAEPGPETPATEEPPAPEASPEAGSPDVWENAYFRVTMPGPWQGKAVFRALDDRTVSLDCGDVPLAVIGADVPGDYLRGDVYIAWSSPLSSGEDVYIQASSVYYALVFGEMTDEQRKDLLLLTTGGAYASDTVGFEDWDALFDALTPYYGEILVPCIELKTPAREEPPAAAAGTAFYGIWCLSSRDRADAQRMAETLTAAGWPAEVIDTAEWDGLNDGWYSVTAGRYDTQEAAEAALASVKMTVGDAYVKYSGDPVR